MKQGRGAAGETIAMRRFIGLSLLLLAGPVRAQTAPSDAVAAPGETVVLTVHALGAQIYECKADPIGKLVWQFREPVALLHAGGKTIGRHYPGPTWELNDGGLVTGRATGRAPGATVEDISWLRLEIASRKGEGRLAEVTTIQRLNTKGGLALGPCDRAGELRNVPYSADYVFVNKGG